MIFPQPLMILLGLALPAFFIYVLKRNLLVVAWIAIITIVDIFNSQVYMNLAAILLCGAVVIPYLWAHRKQLADNKSTWAFALYFILLFALGIYHGFLAPWPDTTGLRSIKDQAHVRSILHLGRTFLEFCVVLFLVLELERKTAETLKVYLKTLYMGSLALCMGAIFERLLIIDFYHFFTGGRAYWMDFRSRSFAYEPRGLSQNLAHSILLTPFTKLGNWKYLGIILFLIFGIYATFSFSGIVVLAAGAAALSMFFVFSRRAELKNLRQKLLISFLLICAGGAIIGKALPPYPKQYLLTHLNFINAPSIAEKLEIYDASSINFLNHNPKYYLFGTGPGLIYLPATSYILPRDQEVFHGGFEALPHMGLVLILSNSGIIGLLLLLFAFIFALKRKFPLKSDAALIACITIATFLFQIRYFYLFGLACLIARESEADE